MNQGTVVPRVSQTSSETRKGRSRKKNPTQREPRSRESRLQELEKSRTSRCK